MCVFSTKLEPISKTSDFARAERMVALYFSVRIGAEGDAPRLAASLWSAPKTKKYPFYFLPAPPQTPPPKIELEGYFFVLVSSLHPPKNSVSVSIYLRAFHSAFLRLRNKRGVLLYVRLFVLTRRELYFPYI